MKTLFPLRLLRAPGDIGNRLGAREQNINRHSHVMLICSFLTAVNPTSSVQAGSSATPNALSSVFFPSRSAVFPQLHHESLRRPTLHSSTPLFPQWHLFGCTPLLQAGLQTVLPPKCLPNPGFSEHFLPVCSCCSPLQLL